MRHWTLLLFCTISLLSSAQSAEKFLYNKGYLVRGMASLSLEDNRTGWWRLSAPIAVQYGLEVSDSYDQRRDPVWATEAARKYWEDLFEIFDDTVLADDAFVNGPTHARKLAFDALGYLDQETEFVKWRELGSDSLPELERVGLKVSGSIYWADLKELLDWNDAQYRIFKAQNPAIVGQHLRLDDDAYIRLSPDLSNAQVAEWRLLGETRDSASIAALQTSRDRISKNIPDPSTHERVVYRVKSGDFLGAVANRYHVPLSDLKKWNNLNSDMIRVGQELVIYARKSVVQTPAPSTTAGATTPSEGRVRSDEESREEVKYKVKAGDTLWSIARAYPGVSADDIMRWNGIDEDIREGQELLILIPEAQ